MYRLIRVEDDHADYRRGDMVQWFNKVTRKWVDAVIVNAAHPMLRVGEPSAMTTLWWVRDNESTSNYERLRLRDTQMIRRPQ